FDALHMSFRELKVKKDRSCPVCGENPRVRELIDYEAFCGLTQEQQAQASTFQITPEELKEKLERGERIILLDVREPVEYEICRLEGATLVPLSKLPEYVNRLSQTEDIVVYCHTGMRSAMAVKLLRDLGFTRVKNLAGGIDAWAVRIDPKMPRY
ncbi:MAG TPA: molybdenum cofactor biosynthesis protein MoeB, partial [Aigarchaeota archaeon]|nr:molybdenum cofactor biosynthesis protein MoeB [Aigarchaeota archaeon]